MAAFGAIQELIWTKGVLGEIGFDYVGPLILHMDSQSAMALARNPTHHKRSKHIDMPVVIHYFHHNEFKRPLQTSADQARLPIEGLIHLLVTNGVTMSSR